MPPNDWTFQFTGFMNVTAQFGISSGRRPRPGQSSTVFHVPPSVVDEYQSFVGTSHHARQLGADELPLRQPGRDREPDAVSTWNPSQPTTFYQLGSQGFVNNAFLTYNIAPLGKLRLRATLGYFFNNYGNLGQYTAGMYRCPTSGPRAASAACCWPNIR